MKAMTVYIYIPSKTGENSVLYVKLWCT